MSFLDEFKVFAIKGNAMDMAVGIVVGAAFTKIVNSLVNDLIMPPLGLVIGGVEFRHLQIVLRAAYTGPAGETVPEVAVRYGAFINTLLEFLIIAFSMFIVVKFMNRLIRKREQQPS